MNFREIHNLRWFFGFPRNGSPKYLIFHWLQQHFSLWRKKWKNSKILIFREISKKSPFSLNFTKFQENSWNFNFCAPKLKTSTGITEFYRTRGLKSLNFIKIKKFTEFHYFRKKLIFMKIVKFTKKLIFSVDLKYLVETMC